MDESSHTPPVGPLTKLSENAFSDLKTRQLSELYKTYNIAPADQERLESAILEVIAGCLF